MIQLYDYQKDIIEQTREHMKSGKKRILIQSPTGSGKTVIFSHIVSEMKKANKRALIITDRIELLFETGGTLEEFDLKPYHILAGQMVEPPNTHQVYVAMSQTLKRRIGKWINFFRWFDVVIIDECHKQEFTDFFTKSAFQKDTFILGFSATPLRSGKQRQLGEDYEVMITGLQVPELIQRGKLVKDIYYGAHNAPSMAGVRTNSKGDYQEGQMYERFNKRELYAGVVDNWEKLTPNTSTLVFCVNIDHVVETCKEFNRKGIPAKFLTSPVAHPIKPTDNDPAKLVKYEIKMQEYNNWYEAYQQYSGDRKVILNQWKRNDFFVLINAGILTTGFNRKNIETIIINRATKSIPLWLQMLGRGSRIFSGTKPDGTFNWTKKHFNILDFGNNGQELGYYNQQREWSLFHDQKEGGGAAPVKNCGQGDPISGEKGKPDKRGNHGCGAYIFASAQICPYCGYIFSSDKRSKEIELVEINYNEPIQTKEPEWRNFERVAESRGYKYGWVIMQIIVTQGEQGLIEFAKAKKYSSGWIWRMRRQYATQLRKHAEQHV